MRFITVATSSMLLNALFVTIDSHSDNARCTPAFCAVCRPSSGCNMRWSFRISSGRTTTQSVPLLFAQHRWTASTLSPAAAAVHGFHTATTPSVQHNSTKKEPMQSAYVQLEPRSITLTVKCHAICPCCCSCCNGIDQGYACRIPLQVRWRQQSPHVLGNGLLYLNCKCLTLQYPISMRMQHVAHEHVHSA